MREFTKSMMSYTWAMSMFGVQQVFNLLAPQQDGNQTVKAAEAFDNVTNATVETLDNTLGAAFRAGDDLQKGMLDLMFGGFSGGGFNPDRWVRMGSDVMHQMSDLGMSTARSAADCSTRSAGQASPASDDSTQPGGPAAQQTGGWGPMPR
jgi:hypothetical protein